MRLYSARRCAGLTCVVPWTRELMRSLHAYDWRLRSSRSVKVYPPHKLFFTFLTVRSTLPFVWGVYGLQTRAPTPIETMKSAKRGFHRGLFSSISNKTLFMRSVSATDASSHQSIQTPPSSSG